MDQVRQQWRRPVHYAHGSASACGVVILCREGTFENIVCAHQETTGRMVVVDMEKSGKKYRITNVYAPKDEKEREIVFKKIPIWCNDESLVIGDFNVVLSKKDLSAQNVYKEDASRQIIYNIMSDNNLVDIWWIKNPHKRSYSRQQIVQGKLKQTRIDLCLSSSALASQIKHAKYFSNSWSDHSFLEVRLRVPGLTRSYQELPFAENILEWWEGAKLRIK